MADWEDDPNYDTGWEDNIYDETSYDPDSNGNFSPDSVSPNHGSLFNHKDLSTVILGIGKGGGFGDLISTLLRPMANTLGKQYTPGIVKWIDKNYSRIARFLYLPTVLWFLSTYVANNMHKFWTWLMSYAMASVTIDKSDHELHNSVKGWILTHAMFRTRRALIAQSTPYATARSRAKVTDGTRIVFEGHSKIQFFRQTQDGYSPKKIQELLYDIQSAEDLAQETCGQTRVFSASCSDWVLQSKKARRSPETVCLNFDEKKELIDDIDDYLHPETALWYAQNEIPYRRGYLLHGKPGCGKTSLAMAIAGHCQLDIYTMSLLDKNITDAILLQLFQKLGSGCLVLLEDVDCAGLGREFQKEDGNSTQHAQAVVDKAVVVTKVQDTGTGVGDAKEPELPTQVTLSGLLNAIDGVSAPEGHVLIMTTNHPELLDPALIRPGRCDIKVEFDYASKEQIRGIFLKMYSHRRSDKAAKYDSETLSAMANAFAEVVPAATFSPAELQQHLLIYRTSPENAIDKAPEMVERKQRGTFIRSGTGAEDQSVQQNSLESNPFYILRDLNDMDQRRCTQGKLRIGGKTGRGGRNKNALGAQGW